MRGSPHKFVQIQGREGEYQWAFGCEYCGLIVFDANSVDTQERELARAAEGCPCSPMPRLVALSSPIELEGE